jgi:hypothetical protein
MQVGLDRIPHRKDFLVMNDPFKPELHLWIREVVRLVLALTRMDVFIVEPSYQLIAMDIDYPHPPVLRSSHTRERQTQLPCEFHTSWTAFIGKYTIRCTHRSELQDITLYSLHATDPAPVANDAFPVPQAVVNYSLTS